MSVSSPPRACARVTTASHQAKPEPRGACRCLVQRVAPVTRHRGHNHGACDVGLELNLAVLVDAATRAVDVRHRYSRLWPQPGETPEHEARAALAQIEQVGCTEPAT